MFPETHQVPSTHYSRCKSEGSEQRQISWPHGLYTQGQKDSKK